MARHATFNDAQSRAHAYPSAPQQVHEDPKPDLTASEDTDLNEPVAVVGFSFRFPEEACSTDSFWKMLMEQRCTAIEFPKDRLSASALYHPDSNRRGTVHISQLSYIYSTRCQYRC